MTEKILKDFFDNLVSVDKLSADLKDSQKRTSYDVTTVYITETTDPGQYELTCPHLIKLCNVVLDGQLALFDLNTLAFGLIASEYFTWDNDKEGDRIELVLNDWDNPEIGFPLTLKNVELWKAYLETGEYKLDPKGLKRR